MTTPIPQPRGVPLLGNIFDIDPSNTWSSLKTLAEKYGKQTGGHLSGGWGIGILPRGKSREGLKADARNLHPRLPRPGEIFQITVLGKTIVFVAGAALAEELCDERRFRKLVAGPIVEIRYAVHDALFTAFDHEESWGVAHRIIAPRLGREAVGDMFGEMRDATAALVERWRGLGESNNNNAVISPIKELNRLNLEVTTRTLFGKALGDGDGDGGGAAGAEHPMIQAMEDATSEAMRRPTRPGLVNWLLYGGKFRRATAAMRAYAADLVRHRRAGAADRRDLLWALLHGRDPETGRALTESQVLDEIVSMPIGSSTAPALLSTAVYYLAENPAVVEKARRELDAVVGGVPGSGSSGDGRPPPLEREHLARLPYVEGVLREAMRLGFPAPGFNIEPIPRAAAGGDDGGGGREREREPVLLGGGKYAVAPDQGMIVVLAGVNRDPTVFADPLAFDPDRMVGEAFGRLPAGARRWFGNGKRECVGRHWAWQFCLVVLVALLRELDLEKADPAYELRQDGWFNLRPVDFYAKVRPRAAPAV